MGTSEGRGGLATVNAYNAETPDTPILPGAVKLAPIVEGAVGGNQPHNNMQPWIGVPHIICMYGIYPSRN
jgi:microcystin-dependent protein